MPNSIYLLSNAGHLQELTEAPYLSEAKLQELLANHPDLLAGKQLDAAAPRRWLFIDREIGIPDQEEAGNRWSLDHLFIDQDGIPTLVEVKRATDTRIRREVVGQILDYAANASSYWTIEGIIASFEQSCEARKEDPDQVLADFLGADAGARSGTEEAAFWEAVNTNLRAGKIRMLIVADYIPSELQRIIEFLNEQMSPADILGVAIKQYKSGDFRTLVPTVVGLTSAGESKKVRRSGGKQKNRWTVADFLAYLGKKHSQAGKVARIIIEHLSEQGYTMSGGTGKYPTIIPELNDPITLYPFAMGGRNFIEIYFQWYLSRAPFHQLSYRQELQTRLNAIEGVNIPADKLDKRPSFPMDILANTENVQLFLDTYDWFLAEVRKHN